MTETTESSHVGEVIDFPTRTAPGVPDDGPLSAAAVPDGVPDDRADEDEDNVDRESVAVERVPLGRPVDPPDEPRSLFPRARRDRAPVVPPWMASGVAIRTSVRWAVKETRYHALFHGIRAPKYAAKTAVFAAVGPVRIAGRLARWASAEDGNWHLRQLAADHGNAAEWLQLDARRQRQARWRWPLVTFGTVAAFATLWLLFFPPNHRPVPALVRAAVLLALVGVLARLGRPADKPITDRVSAAKTYRKL